MKEINKVIIDKISDGNKLTLSLEGRLTTATAVDLEKSLNESLDGVTELVFDFSDLKYISSAGMRVLLSAQKRMSSQGSMMVTGVSNDIMEIFEITGFTDILTIE